jgi:hypothetical protein
MTGVKLYTTLRSKITTRVALGWRRKIKKITIPTIKSGVDETPCKNLDASKKSRRL